MSKVRTSVRIINRLLISIFLVLSSVLGIPVPVSAEDASINLRLPWLSGDSRINGGSTYGCGLHTNKDFFALDFQMGLDRPITAVAPGVAHYETQTDQSGNLVGYGKYIWIDHANNYVSLYAHLNNYAPGIDGQTVQQGQVIGYAGGTGGVPVHLHFALRKNANAKDDGQAAEPIPMSGYSNFGSIPCGGTSDPYNPATNAPGGWWVGPTPNDNSMATPGSVVNVASHGVDNNNGGLDKVNMTFYQPGRGWSVLKTTWFPQNTAESNASSGFIMPDTPYVMISFDVYSRNGNYQKSPSGIRKICNLLVTTTCVHNPGDGGTGTVPGGGSGQTGCVPGQYQAAVFADANYGGSCVVKDVGTYNDPAAIGLPNDSISSLKIGSGAQLTLCDNAGMNSPCEWFTADDPDLANNTINTNTVSSLRVEGNQPTTGCNPSDTQVSFFEHPDWTGLCITKNVGVYNDPGAIGLANDSISSIRVGAKAKVRVCNNAGMNSPCEEFDQSDSNLNNNSINTDTISAAEVYLKGGIRLCDGTNYGGECKYFGTGKYNMQDYGFNDRAESVAYDAEWAGLYHIVLWSENNQTGNPAHYDNSVGDIGGAMRNHVRSIEIYKHGPPHASLGAPNDGTIFPSNTTSVTLNFDGGDSRRVHVWGNGIDQTLGWTTAKTWQLSNLTPGTYSWQAQGRGVAGEGPWTAVRTFSINTPPTVVGGDLTIAAGASETIQIQAYDAEGSPLSLTASGLPSFATFTDNGGGVGALSLTPGTSAAGQYQITIAANDGSVTASGVINLTVTPPPAPPGYLANYFNNLTLSGTPVLTRDEAVINNDWGAGGPGSGVNVDNFSARWTRTVNFAAGTYRFSVTADDGVRLYIDDVLSIDKWIDQGATTYTVDKMLTTGNHTLKVEYYESGGGAVAKFSYQAYSSPATASGITSGNTYKLINPNSNKALDVNGGGIANGTNVHIWEDNGSPAQKWQITQNADGTYKLVNPNSNKALDVNGGGMANGTNVQIWEDNASPAQRWQLTQNADGTYKLINPNSAKALDVNGAGTTNGTNVHIWEDNGTPAQKWQIIDISSANPPPPSGGTELLSAPWNLVGNNGAVEKYQSIPSNALAGKTTLRITYDLHGLTALGGDASAIIFDQNGWKYVSLSNYGQNGLNGSQTVDIPLSAFGLDLSQPVGTLHTRFWYSGPFMVDITSIKVL